jgi:hypothetical protein
VFASERGRGADPVDDDASGEEELAPVEAIPVEEDCVRGGEDEEDDTEGGADDDTPESRPVDDDTLDPIDPVEEDEEDTVSCVVLSRIFSSSALISFVFKGMQLMAELT